jgi:hypothetical protein
MIRIPHQAVACTFTFLLGLLAPAAVLAAKVDNFVLIDHLGVAHELYYGSNNKAVVLIGQANACAAVRASVADYNRLADRYSAQGVQVLMINSTGRDSRAEIAAEATQWDIELPILDDSSQIIGHSLQLLQAGEIIVIDPGNWQVVYRGGLTSAADSPVAGDAVATALDSLIAGQPVNIPGAAVSGCDLEYPAPATISYSETVAPILIENCVACHTEGGIGPWAMSEYRMVQGFAPMMREVIRTRRMPPWHVDPALGEWQHDAGLSDADRSTLVSWIEAGAPRGTGEDPLVSVPAINNSWTLGEPDLMLEVPAFEVPATGVVDYQYPVLVNPLDHGVWVVAATIIPGDTQAVHHVLMGSADTAPAADDKESVFQNYIMGYAPGNESAHMPEGTGVYVPPGGVYLLQMHYTPYGKPATDHTRVGLYFAKADEVPANFLRQHVVLNPKLSIPPHAAAHEERAYFEFYHDATIYSLVPHSHYRGHSSTFELAYPNGSTELILSVPNYDFNWQRTYSFAEPRQVPAGTRIIHRTVYDNSAQNPANPDPDRKVPWGLQSTDEMLYGSVSFSWTDERSDAPIHDLMTADAAQWLGFADSNMDGKMSRDEMWPSLRERIGWRWWFLDTNFSGGLELPEMEKLLRGMKEG